MGLMSGIQSQLSNTNALILRKDQRKRFFFKLKTFNFNCASSISGSVIIALPDWRRCKGSKQQKTLKTAMSLFLLLKCSIDCEFF